MHVHVRYARTITHHAVICNHAWQLLRIIVCCYRETLYSADSPLPLGVTAQSYGLVQTHSVRLWRHHVGSAEAEAQKRPAVASPATLLGTPAQPLIDTQI